MKFYLTALFVLFITLDDVSSEKAKYRLFKRRSHVDNQGRQFQGGSHESTARIFNLFQFKATTTTAAPVEPPITTTPEPPPPDIPVTPEPPGVVPPPGVTPPGEPPVEPPGEPPVEEPPGEPPVEPPTDPPPPPPEPTDPPTGAPPPGGVPVPPTPGRSYDFNMNAINLFENEDDKKIDDDEDEDNHGSENILHKSENKSRNATKRRRIVRADIAPKKRGFKETGIIARKRRVQMQQRRLRQAQTQRKQLREDQKLHRPFERPHQQRGRQRVDTHRAGRQKNRFKQPNKTDRSNFLVENGLKRENKLNNRKRKRKLKRTSYRKRRKDY